MEKHNVTFTRIDLPTYKSCDSDEQEPLWPEVRARYEVRIDGKHWFNLVRFERETHRRNERWKRNATEVWEFEQTFAVAKWPPSGYRTRKEAVAYFLREAEGGAYQDWPA